MQEGVDTGAFKPSPENKGVHYAARHLYYGVAMAVFLVMTGRNLLQTLLKSLLTVSSLVVPIRQNE